MAKLRILRIIAIQGKCSHHPQNYTKLIILRIIVMQYGIMLSARKMVMAQPNINFLEMKITNGNFLPQVHLATALFDFPDGNLTK